MVRTIWVCDKCGFQRELEEDETYFDLSGWMILNKIKDEKELTIHLCQKCVKKLNL